MIYKEHFLVYFYIRQVTFRDSVRAPTIIINPRRMCRIVTVVVCMCVCVCVFVCPLKSEYIILEANTTR